MENNMDTKNILISMNDDYISGCLEELEDSLLDGWQLVDQEYDEITETSFLTLERAVI